jgi:hypothetical protein
MFGKQRPVSGRPAVWLSKRCKRIVPLEVHPVGVPQMLRACSGVITVVLMVAPTAQATEATLVLACKGTAKIKSGALEYNPDPISMGLIVNFTTRTVQGTARWGPYLFDDQIPITEWNEGPLSFPVTASFLVRTSMATWTA